MKPVCQQRFPLTQHVGPPSTIYEQNAINSPAEERSPQTMEDKAKEFHPPTSKTAKPVEQHQEGHSHSHRGQRYADTSIFSSLPSTTEILHDICVATWNVDGRILVTVNAILASLANIFEHHSMDVLCIQDIRLTPAQGEFLVSSLLAMARPWSIVLRCATPGKHTHMGGLWCWSVTHTNAT